MSEWRDPLTAGERRAVERHAISTWSAPMLETLTEDRFPSPDWIFEPKLDGERCLVFRRPPGSARDPGPR